MRYIARCGIALVVLLVSLVALPGVSWASWEPADITAVNIKKVCKNGIKFDAAVLNGFGPSGDYLHFAVVTDPPPSGLPVPSDSVVVRTRIRISKLNKPKDVDLPGGGKLTISHLRSFEIPFFVDLGVGDQIALNVQDFDPNSGYSTATVGNCSL